VERKNETHTENDPALWDLIAPFAPSVYGELHAAHAILVF
jgi:hypothetical protein